ncbi:MAG: hypothetical protein LBF38_06630 [Deltaproteobacteria bacterium]|jgi:hypothetical protein|nr:hypothetical protein [Deltaproteobacteria bacterium]
MSDITKINNAFYNEIKEATKQTVESLKEQLEFNREVQDLIQKHNRDRLKVLKADLSLRISDRAAFILGQREKALGRLKSRWRSKPPGKNGR